MQRRQKFGFKIVRRGFGKKDHDRIANVARCEISSRFQLINERLHQ